MKNAIVIQRYAKLVWFKALATSRVDLGQVASKESEAKFFRQEINHAD